MGDKNQRISGRRRKSTRKIHKVAKWLIEADIAEYLLDEKSLKLVKESSPGYFLTTHIKLKV